MAKFIAWRLAGTLVATIAAVTIVFGVIKLAPGDPAEAALAQSSAPQAVIESRRRALGLNDPLWLQYANYVSNVLEGDLGVSWASGQPVADLIGDQLAATGILATTGAFVALIVGVSLGVLSVTGPLRPAAQFIATGFLATPVVLSGTILIWIFVVTLGWLPATGQETPRHWILPALVVGLSAGSGVAKAVEVGLTETLSQPFMRTARAKGLSRTRAIWRHGLRVGLLQAFELMTLQFGYLLGGTMITETVFARQGVGRVLVAAILTNDLPVVQGVVIMSVLIYSILSLLSDVFRGWLDPRLRMEV